MNFNSAYTYFNSFHVFKKSVDAINLIHCLNSIMSCVNIAVVKSKCLKTAACFYIMCDVKSTFSGVALLFSNIAIGPTKT